MASKSWTIENQNARVSFSVKKLGLITIRGNITDFTGEVAFDKDAIEQSRFTVCVSPSTIHTGNGKRDEHLKSKDFFHVNEHPKICFESTTVKKANDNYQAIGQLSILGVTREVSIPFSFVGGVIKGEFALNRLDYNLGEKFPAFIVGKTIQISINCKIK